jgi:tripartite-type tricarboxylate transporter receptor subunit TctC
LVRRTWRFPAKTVPDFVAYAKGNPGKISVASPGNGTTQHLSGELFNLMTDVTMVHVPYCGPASALTDPIGGQVQPTFDAVPSSFEQIRGGKLRALAVTSATRLEALPTRYDKLAANYLAFIKLASIRIWLRANESTC